MDMYILKKDVLKYLERKSNIEISTNSAAGIEISRVIDALYCDIDNMIPADVLPLDVVCKEIAELIGNPCRIVKASRFMDYSCYDCSTEVSSTECWKRYFKKKLAIMNKTQTNDLIQEAQKEVL